MRWWHSNGARRGGYALRGWRRGNVYPDFLFAALHEADKRDWILVIETKGLQKGGARGFPFEHEPFDFGAAVVLFGDFDARLPALIQGEAIAATA